VVSESPYIRLVKNKQPEPDPDYVHDLVVLRAMVRQEHRQGDVGWGGSWTKERYQRLKDKHPEALLAFEAELRWEREEAQLRRETLVKYKDSPYIEAQKRAYPANPDKDRYLKSLERLRHIMILFKLGYGSSGMSMLKVNSKRRYPEAYEVFTNELEDL
jgi:hypothetical protein